MWRIEETDTYFCVYDDKMNFIQAFPKDEFDFSYDEFDFEIKKGDDFHFVISKDNAVFIKF